MSSKELIDKLRKDFGIEEKKLTPEEDAIERAEIEARTKRIEEAGTVENYVKMFHRDFWTDEWLGPGPEEPMPYLEDFLPKKEQKKAMEQRHEREIKEWQEKYGRKDLPKYKLPVQKETKAIRKARKKRKKEEVKKNRQIKYDVTYWLLHDYLSPEFSMMVWEGFKDDFEGMVDHCYDLVCTWSRLFVRDKKKRNISPTKAYEMLFIEEEEEKEVVEEVGGFKFKSIITSEKHKKWINTDVYENTSAEIPDAYWDEFDKWADKHPLKKYEKKAKKLGGGVTARRLRRITFLKKINKRNKGFRKNMMLHDPITGASFVSEKKMKEHYKKKMEQYNKERDEFIKMVEGMVERGELSEDAADDWIGRTKETTKRIEKRFKHVQKETKNIRKQREDEEEQTRRVNKERREWFKKYGNGIDIDNMKPFTIMAGGEELKFEIKRSKDRTIFKLDRPGHTTTYSESLDDFCL